MRLFIILFTWMIFINPLTAQNQMSSPELNLENIWKENKFTAKSVPGFSFLANGSHYTKLQKNQIISFHLLSGNEVETIFDGGNDSFKEVLAGNINDYIFSPDEQKLLILLEQEAIYRRSNKAITFFLTEKRIS